MTETHRKRTIVAGAALAALVSLAMLSGCSGPSAAEPEAPAPAKADIQGYKLGPGDRIKLTVYDEPNLTGEFNVDGGGNLGVPLIGQIKAGGLTADQLEKKIADKLSPEFLKDPSVNVEIIGYRPFYIVGEVQKPGSYPYVNGMTVINAVALAGGFTYRAREDDFRIKRRGKNNRALEAHPTTEVLPGDVITVRERYF